MKGYRICVECKFHVLSRMYATGDHVFGADWIEACCQHPQAMIDLVTGEIPEEPMPCRNARYGGFCGLDGRGYWPSKGGQK